MRNQLQLFQIIAFLPKLALILMITDQATWYGKTSRIFYISTVGEWGRQGNSAWMRVKHICETKRLFEALSVKNIFTLEQEKATSLRDKLPAAHRAGKDYSV